MPEFGKNNKSTVEKEEEVMKIKNKILTIMATGVALSALIMPNKSNAALQSNGGTHVKKYASEWILQIRQMQEMGGTLGRTDSINTKNLTSNATDLDIHMEKNTEYGAMAILSASAYGNPNKIENGGTTTGNSTGIVFDLSYERVAAKGANDTGYELFENATSRYINNYANGKSKIGDALVETKGWHGSTNYTWFIGGKSGLIRCCLDSVFSYFGGSNNEKLNGVYIPASLDDRGRYSTNWYSRACIVVGTGI